MQPPPRKVRWSWLQLHFNAFVHTFTQLELLLAVLMDCLSPVRDENHVLVLCSDSSVRLVRFWNAYYNSYNPTLSHDVTPFQPESICRLSALSLWLLDTSGSCEAVVEWVLSQSEGWRFNPISSSHIPKCQTCTSSGLYHLIPISVWFYTVNLLY